MHLPARIFLATLLWVMQMTAGQANLLSALHAHKGEQPPVRKILEAIDLKDSHARNEALLELRQILKDPVHAAVWPGAVFAMGVVGAYVNPSDEQSVADELIGFLEGRSFVQEPAALSSEAVYFEDQARLTVPSAFAYLCALNAPPTSGNESQGRSANRIVKSLDHLENVLRGETTERTWRTGKKEDRDLELRFRALQALIQTGRDDAKGRIQSASRDVKDASLRSEINVELKRLTASPTRR